MKSPPRQYINATVEHGPATKSSATVEHAATAQALPDNRLLVTLDDGRSFVIDAEHLMPQSDGSYHVKLTAAAAAPFALHGEQGNVTG